MRYDRAHKMDDEANACRHAHPWQPDAKNKAQCTGKLTSSQEQEVLQRYTDHFVDHVNYLWVSGDLGDCGERHHRREDDSDVQICDMHTRALIYAHRHGL